MDPPSVRLFVAAFSVLVVASGVAAAPTDLRLVQAVKNRDVALVRDLLKARSPKVDVNAAQGDGATALHWAAHRDDLTIADLLIRAGARATVANDLGATPLHLACTNRSAPTPSGCDSFASAPAASRSFAESTSPTRAANSSGVAPPRNTV